MHSLIAFIGQLLFTNNCLVLSSSLEPYLRVKYSIKSTEELLELLKVTQPIGILTSLDVESLFTNVAIDDTISIILNSVYRHPNIPPPNLPKETLKKLLEICTKKSRFKHIDETIYKQKDGVAMSAWLHIC